MPGEDRPTVSIITLGCKLNQSDSDSISRRISGTGANIVDRPVRDADAFVINTCSVTHIADRKARHLVRLARRLSPRARIILTGCYAETAPDGTAEAIGADAVYRNTEKGEIPERLLEYLSGRGDPAAGCPDGRSSTSSLRTRAFIKIQEGCDELCAFCIVPYTRGREVSVALDEVVRRVRERESEGVLEVVLTGTQLGNYGRDLGWQETGPRPLLEALLERTSIPRIRLSSLQAQDISLPLLSLWQDRRLCPHFHLPLQSGSNTVLAAMRRRYAVDDLRDAVSLIRETVPDVAVTTDVIAGFPGETDGDFEATYRLCEEVRFADMHCFPYSKRPHTGAALMDGHLLPEVRRGRLERLLALAQLLSSEFRKTFLGRTLDVLWEEQKASDWEGLTGNYIRLYACAEDDLQNRILPVRLDSLQSGGVRGTLMERVPAA